MGGYLNLGFSKVTKGSPTRFDYGVVALGRYDVSPGEAAVDNILNHGRWFFEGSLGIGGSSVERGNSTTGLDFGVGPGHSYFITPNIGVEGLIRYVVQSGFGNNGLNTNITFNVGFNIYLPGGQAEGIANQAN